MTQTDHFPKAIGFAWAIVFAKWLFFKLVSFLEYLVFFRAVFCTEQFYYSCRMVFRMFLAFLIFDPNWPFCKGYRLCMGYSLCKMGVFNNLSHFSNIWCFFERLFAQSNLNVLVALVFRMFLAFLIFDPNWLFSKRYRLRMGYSLCKMAHFQTCLISRIFGVFSSGFLHRTT